MLMFSHVRRLMLTRWRRRSSKIGDARTSSTTAKFSSGECSDMGNSNIGGQRGVTRVVIHSSLSNYGCVDVIRKWHQDEPLKLRDIGYHWTCSNGRPRASNEYLPEWDGKIEPGRPELEEGAHCKAMGANADSIGFCFVSRGGVITLQQLYLGIDFISSAILDKYDLGSSAVRGHYELDPERKAKCPGWEMSQFRHLLRIWRAQNH